MIRSDFQKWLKHYGEAWEDKDTKKFSELFSEDAVYHWTPFENPQKGRKEIQSAVESAISSQGNIKFGFKILSFENNTGICNWWCRFDRISTGNHIKLNGIFVCEFNKASLCSVFREWWHKEGE